MVEEKVEDISKTKNMFRKGWPRLIGGFTGPFIFPVNWFSIQMSIWTLIFWPKDAYIHYSELAFAFGLMYILGAITKLLAGYLADRHPRMRLLSFYYIFQFLAFTCFGFVPEGLGITSYLVFLIIVIFRELFTAVEVISSSYIDDAIEEENRSQFYGIAGVIAYAMSIPAMLVIPLLFRGSWRFYFWIVGIIGICIGVIMRIKGKEPKRGAEKGELKNILAIGDAEYKYKLNKETIKATVLSKTNLIILFEGLFTQMMLAVPASIFYAFIESQPRNISPLTVSLMGLFFAIPGGLFGAMAFSKFSDRVAKKDIKNRVLVLFTSIICFYAGWFVIFFLPYPALTPAQGDNLVTVLSFPTYWAGSALVFIGYTLMSVFGINQRPLVQKINLPEAQGAVMAANSFLEVLSTGIGSIIAGVFYIVFGENYFLTIGIMLTLGSIGACMWLLCLKYIDNDVERVSTILKDRAKEIENSHNLANDQQP
ncbi:MAG: MFS transporter [Candidatus Hodarchaeota archaeon]